MRKLQAIIYATFVVLVVLFSPIVHEVMCAQFKLTSGNGSFLGAGMLIICTLLIVSGVAVVYKRFFD